MCFLVHRAACTTSDDCFNLTSSQCENNISSTPAAFTTTSLVHSTNGPSTNNGNARSRIIDPDDETSYHASNCLCQRGYYYNDTVQSCKAGIYCLKFIQSCTCLILKPRQIMCRGNEK